MNDDLEGSVSDEFTDLAIEIDPDLDPLNPVNLAAARQRDLTYDPLKEAYVDCDGCLILDKYGQRM